MDVTEELVSTSSWTSQTHLKLTIIEPIEHNSKIQIFREDANELVKKIKFDICYIDPPYNSNIIQECLINLKKYNLINADSVIFAETSKNEILDLPDFEILETKTYGKSKLTIIKLLELSSIK